MVEASDLVIHHRVLQKFLQDSESGASQPNSARVAKAREKLAKLSVSQFAELSTDVYDELQRRTTTSPSKPRFLQPKPTFHPKRNQAREKLASLQESRFRDLVKDIAFEVERRGFHQSVEQTTHVGEREIVEKQKFDNNLDILKQSPEKPKTYQNTYADESFGLNDTTDNFPEVESSNQKEVRSKLVVPKKSSLSWSSDEEDEVFPKGDAAVAESTPINSPIKERLSLRRSKDTDLNLLMEESTKMDRQITELEKEKKELVSEIEELKARLDDSDNELNKQKRAWELEKQQLEQQLSEVQQNLDFKHEELENAKQASADWQSRHQNVNEDFSRLQGMYEDLTDKHRVLVDNHANEKEKLVDEMNQLRDMNDSNSVSASETSNLVAELIALKQQHANLKTEHETMAKSVMDHQELSRQYDALKSEHEAVKSKHDSLQRSLPTHLSELETLRSSVATLQAENEKLKAAKPSVATSSEDVISLKKEVMDWQKKYHAVSSGSLDESLKSSQLNDEYVRSLTNASGVIQSSSVSSLMASSKVLLLQIDSENLDVDTFFNNVSELATYAGNIATEAESNGILSATEQCRYVRAAIANFITAARYYAIYGKSIPKLVIQAAINDVCFTVCDLIAIVKVGGDSGRSTAVPKTPVGQVFPRDLSRPTSNAVEDDEVTPVRPLKMAQRLGSASPSPEQPRSRNSPTPRMSFVVKPSPGSKLKEETSATPPKTKDVPSGLSSQVSPSSVKSSILSRVQQFESPEKENKKFSPTKEAFPTSNAGFSKFGLKANSVSPTHSRTTSKDTVDSKTIPLNNSTASANIMHNRTNSIELQRKATTKETFDVSRFDIRDPDNTLEQLLHYLEHQTVEVIAAIQTMLASIKDPNITIGALRANAEQILDVISQMVEATSTSMNQTRNAMLKEHGSWIVQSLIDCAGRMKSLCQSNLNDQDYADKNFKQRLAGVTFDIVRSTNELAKTVEEASLKEEIAILDARLQNNVSVVA